MSALSIYPCLGCISCFMHSSGFLYACSYYYNIIYYYSVCIVVETPTLLYHIVYTTARYTLIYVISGLQIILYYYNNNNIIIICVSL